MLDKISMDKEEKELRELLPKSALLHNCLVLHLAEGVFLYLIICGVYLCFFLYSIFCAVCLLVLFDHLCIAEVLDNDSLIFVSKMVDGASKLDEKLDGAPFAMFVLAALQL